MKLHGLTLRLGGLNVIEWINIVIGRVNIVIGLTLWRGEH